MLVAHLSDTHVALPGSGLLQFVDGGPRLASALERQRGLDPGPDVLLITGDLFDVGDYPAFAAKLRSGAGLPKSGFGM